MSSRALIRQDLDSLQGRYSEVMEFLVPRKRLSTGAWGYSLQAQTSMTIRVGADPYSPHALEETITFDIDECEVAVPDPTFTAAGSLRFDVEILSIYGKTTSQVLFGEETEVTMRVGRGLDPYARPTFGRTEIRPEDDFGTEFVPSTQWVNLDVDTPYGTLRNREPAEMRASINQLPPLQSPYTQQGVVELFNDRGVRMAAKATAMSTLTEING